MTTLKNFDFPERILKSVNVSIFIMDLEPVKIQWVTNSIAFLIRKSQDDFERTENPDFKKNVTEARDFFFKNPEKSWCRIFKMKRTDNSFRWILTTASVFEKDLYGMPQKSIAAAIDVTELAHSEKSLAVALRQIQQDRHKDTLDRLTKREKEIIRLMIKGYSSKEIAAKLGRSKHTIETHRSNIKTKLECNQQGDIVTIGERIGLAI